MDQMLIDGAERRLKVNNKKEVTLTKSYFKQLADHVSHCLTAARSFNPTNMQPLEQRAKYKALYKWLASQLSDIHEFPIDEELLSGLTTTFIDFAEGIIEVKVTHTYNRKIRNFTVRFNNEVAPYSTRWAGLLTKHGGDGAKFAQLIELV